MVFSPLQGAMKTSVLRQCTSLLPFATSPPPPTLGISLCTATTFLFGLSVLPFSWQRTGRRGKKTCVELDFFFNLTFIIFGTGSY